jgi:two-component system, cell cycle sensor histidine kinase and response regulator CckA
MPPHEEKNQNARDILVVDDNPAGLQLLTRILADNGYRVRPATDGPLALQSVAAKLPDLILLDIKMPGMDGIEVCRRLKADERSRDIPVIFVSAVQEPEAKTRGFDVGGLDFINKPFETGEVLARVRTHLRLSELTKRLEQKVAERTLELTKANLKLRQEIADRKKAEVNLRKSEERLRAAKEAGLDSFLTFQAERDGQGQIIDFIFTDMNVRAEQMLQLNRDYLIGKRMCEELPINKTNGFFEKYKNVVETGIPLEEEFYLPDTHVPAAWRYHQVVKLGDGIVISHRDITERKKTEEALRESRDLLDATQRLARVGGWEWDVEQQTMTWTDETYRIHGMKPGDLSFGSPGHIDRSIACYDPADRLIIESAFRRCVVEGQPYDLEFPLTRTDGSQIWIQTMAHAVKKDNCVIKVVGNIIDITDRKQAEKALRESEERFRGIFISSPIGIAIVDTATHRFLQANESFLKIVGYSIEELQELKVDDIAVPDDWEIEKNLISEYLQAKFGEYGLVKRYKRKNGEMRYVQINGDLLPRHDGKPPLAVANVIDITDRLTAEKEKEQLQGQLQQAQKMEAVGTLAGGVAHDFNNLLQAINGYTQLLLMEKEEKDTEYNSLKAIQDAGLRASDLVRQLLLFSRKADSTKTAIELQHEVEQARRMLERTIPKMVKIQTFIGPQLWSIMADPIQVEQMLLNLGANAADAMPDGGKLIFEIENKTLYEDYASRHMGAQPGKYVLLSVSDTGQGMDKETREKIFEPFFTTKEFGKGTGLGLASVYGIVKSHGGYITCYSEVGQGTTFKIYFPAIEEPEVEETRGVEPKPIPQGTETILLVDDEEAIRGFAQQALMCFGYKILAASSGEEALELYSAKPNEIDLVVMDLGMPGMGGHKCLQELLRINPAVKVVISSGYSINGQVKKSMDAGAKGYVGKPYQLTDLLNTVRSVLDAKN